MPAVLLVSSLFWRSAWKYGNRAYRYAAMDAGHVIENLVQSALRPGHPDRRSAADQRTEHPRTDRLLEGRQVRPVRNRPGIRRLGRQGHEAHRSPRGQRRRHRAAPADPRSRLSPVLHRVPGNPRRSRGLLCAGRGHLESARRRTPRPARCRKARSSIELSTEDIYTDLGLMQATRRRRSTREFTDHPVTVDQFGKINRVTFRSGTYYPVMPTEQTSWPGAGVLVRARRHRRHPGPLVLPGPVRQVHARPLRRFPLRRQVPLQRSGIRRPAGSACA